MKTQVCIIGGGPSGLMLSQLLHLKGMINVVLETPEPRIRARPHPRRRARARLRRADARGAVRRAHGPRGRDPRRLLHRRTTAGWIASTCTSISGGNSVVVYGQTELTRDLYEARDRMKGVVIHNAEDVQPHDLKSARRT